MRTLLLLLTPLLLAAAAPDGLVVRKTDHDFATLVDRTAAAAEAKGLVVVGRASASAAAAGRGVKIPDDAVLMVFNNLYAVRVLTASQAAGLEPPLHLHIAGTPDGHASLSYRLPSAVFRPYHSRELDELGAELDRLFKSIADQAAGH